MTDETNTPNKRASNPKSGKELLAEYDENRARRAAAKEWKAAQLYAKPLVAYSFFMLGILLGIAYIGLASTRFYEPLDDLPIDIFGVFFYIPAAYFISFGTSYDVQKLEAPWDFNLFMACWIFGTLDISMFIIKLVLHIGWLKEIYWLPDLSIDLLYTFACFRRSQLWGRFYSSLPSNK